MGIYYACDGCGARLNSNDAGRFIVKIEAYAAATPIDLSEAGGGSTFEEVIEQLRSADPDEVEDQTYRSFRFDLCPRCHRSFLRQPLGPMSSSAQ